jgi:TolB protein
MNASPIKFLCAVLLLAGAASARADSSLGIFTDHGDVGKVSKSGTALYDPAAGTYTVGAAGANMWFKADAMQFIWKKVSGDVSISANIAFVGSSTQPHRKACLVIRQDLSDGSAYVDVAKHGDGLTSLQFRSEKDGVTKEIQSMVSSPSTVRLDKIGDTVYLSVASGAGDAQPSGASVQLHLSSPYYIGLAVSAHNDDAFETAVFSDVKIGKASDLAAVQQPKLHVITLPSGDQRVTDN